MNKLLFISTNLMWSGSEELWSRSAKNLMDRGYSLFFAAKYHHPELDKLKTRHLIFPDPYTTKHIVKRAIERFVKIKFKSRNLLEEFIRQVSPQLIVISQGNNYESLSLMEYCNKQAIPYITVTQLVGENFIGAFNNSNLPLAKAVYLAAAKNFFVSHHNLKLNNFILGIDLPNAEVLYNPCKLSDKDMPPFPETDNLYTIGLVGRIECWHKGYDLLLHVISSEKWKGRPVLFSLYGDGPHTLFLQTYISTHNLPNLALKGHRSSVTDIWKENQLLCMPSRMEGQALALIEAMWCRRAAVVTNVGGAAELIEEGYSGFIAAAPTVESVDAALERAWEQRSRWKEIGVHAASGLKAKHPADAVDYFNRQILKQLEQTGGKQ